MAKQGGILRTTTSPAELKQAAIDRERDAAVLEAAGHYASAMAARLYALEITLKVLVCKCLDLPHPARIMETHDLNLLIHFTGLSSRVIGNQLQTNLGQNWERITELSENLNDFRYKPAANWIEKQCLDLREWLEDPNDGVMTWLRPLI